MNRLRSIYLLALLCLSLCAHADWQYHLAYNTVSHVALVDDKVYAIGNGALYSVDKNTEKIRTFSPTDGLHGLGLSNMCYDAASDQLLLIYSSGKIDIKHGEDIIYVDGLYKKDMTDNKTVNNITIHNGTAYLSTAFGIVTLNIKKQEIVDTYYIGDKATSVNVRDVVIQGDSIYALTDKWVGSAALADNLVDYRVWTRSTTSAIHFDSTKGKWAQDVNGDLWEADGDLGLKRTMGSTGEVLHYKPDAPLQNSPYRMNFDQGRLFVVPGGRWGSQNEKPGVLMVYDGTHWMNIIGSSIAAITGIPALDFMNTAVDPLDPSHFFVTSYGTGLYEFRGNEFYTVYFPSESNKLCSTAPELPYYYTRLDGAQFDADGTLYLQQSAACTGHIVRLLPNGQWEAMMLMQDNSPLTIGTPTEWKRDNRNPNIYYVPSCRSTPGLAIVDNNGTFEDNSDDKLVFRKQWTDQHGQEVKPELFYSIMQTQSGALWIATNAGPVIIPADVNMLESDRCLRIDIPDGDAPLLSNETINAFTEDSNGNIWIGTATSGVYVLSPDASLLMAHHTVESALLPSNAILSLAFNPTTKRVFVGTAEGLVSYADTYTPIEEVPDMHTEAIKDEMDGAMFRWRLHPAFNNVEHVAVGNNKVYALATGALFSVNKETEEMEVYTKLTGLSASTISHISYNHQTGKLLIIYSNGMIDLLSDDGTVVNMQDLYLKASTLSVTVRDICMNENKAYLAMQFGVVVVDMSRHEIADTYYIGAEASDVDVLHLAITQDSIYAYGADSTLYHASLSDNIIDFRYWKATPTDKAFSTLAAIEGHLYALSGTAIYTWQANHFTLYYTERPIDWMRAVSGRLICQVKDWYTVRLYPGGKIERIDTPYPSTDIDWDANSGTYWQTSTELGLCRLSDYQGFRPNGPIDNNAFEMTFAGPRLYVCPGGRWSDAAYRMGNLHIYDGMWNSWSAYYFGAAINRSWHDIVSVAVNPADPEEYYIASYGAGIVHMKNGLYYNHYDLNNSTLKPVSMDMPDPDEFIRVDGLYVDSLGYLWALNAGGYANSINVKSPEGVWKAYNIYSEGRRVELTTPGNIIPDRRDARYKWLYDQRTTQGVILHFDNGTPMNGADDVAMKRSYFYDQDAMQVVLSEVECLVQDQDNDIWIGTPSGIVIIQHSVDFLKENTCYRVKIPRNDGTNLADYLLGTEKINCIFVDGGNRKWIGTETSGLYLVSPDGLETIEHFTELNSPLLSNKIISLAAHPTTGELFIGTAAGIASYRSDASESQDDLKHVYAFPNPVRADYTGVITISGLMNNTAVNIIDGGGNLVCKTRSNGGIAVWNGLNQHGKRAATGIYTVLCNAGDGKSHTVAKIMVIN